MADRRYDDRHEDVTRRPVDPSEPSPTGGSTNYYESELYGEDSELYGEDTTTNYPELREDEPADNSGGLTNQQDSDDKG